MFQQCNVALSFGGDGGHLFNPLEERDLLRVRGHDAVWFSFAQLSKIPKLRQYVIAMQMGEDLEKKNRTNLNIKNVGLAQSWMEDAVELDFLLVLIARKAEFSLRLCLVVCFVCPTGKHSPLPSGVFGWTRWNAPFNQGSMRCAVALKIMSSLSTQSLTPKEHFLRFPQLYTQAVIEGQKIVVNMTCRRREEGTQVKMNGGCTVYPSNHEDM